MTLAVAECTPLGVRLAADMRLTDPNAAHHGYLSARLKLVLVSPTQCVAYAGRDGLAITAIRHVFREQLDPTRTASYLLDVHVSEAQAADFLIASLDPIGLVAVKGGRAEPCSANWLGDQAAFNEYQRNYHAQHTLLPPDAYESADEAADIEIASRMSSGMQAAVHGAAVDASGNLVLPSGGEFETVGEAVVYAHRRVRHGLFGYGLYNRAQSSGFARPLEPDLGVVPPDFGSAERGAFSFFMLVPVDPGVAAIGLYFAEGAMAILYAPLILDKPRRITQVSREDLVRLVEAEHGIKLEGLGIG
jgi:hypothetical protein